jgi:GNAT superfamily N-acetyltransferase
VLATSLQIDELSIPATLDDPEAAGFIEMVGVRNAIETRLFGSDALACTPAELLPIYQAQEFAPGRIFVARVDGRQVGRAVLQWSIAAGTTSSWLVAEVLEEFRHRGIGSALFDRVEELAARSGRPVLQAEVTHKPAPGGERLPSPTGFGDVPADDPGVRFLTRRGYRLEQIERVSFLDLPVSARVLNENYQQVLERVTGDYSLVHWTGSTPPEWIADLILLRTRMSTDAPYAGLEIDEEPWTEARIATHDAALSADGRTVLTVAARHEPTGRLAGFSALSLPGNRSRAAQQLDTLVLAEHRGHRLGILLKVANLRALQAGGAAPSLVYTFNAEENRHMLTVNEAIGFRPVGHAGCWRKDR